MTLKSSNQSILNDSEWAGSLQSSDFYFQSRSNGFKWARWSSVFRPWSLTSRMIKRLSWLDDLHNFDLDLERRGRSNSWVGLTVFKILTSISTSILDIGVNKPASARFWFWTSRTSKQRRVGLTVFSVSTVDLSGLSHCFILTWTISSSALVIVGWLEVVTSSQIRSSWPFRLARGLSWIRT